LVAPLGCQESLGGGGLLARHDHQAHFIVQARRAEY
jgi:hypothetical protein